MNQKNKTFGKQITFILLAGLFLFAPLLTNNSIKWSMNSKDNSSKYTNTSHPCAASVTVTTSLEDLDYIDKNIELSVFTSEYGVEYGDYIYKVFVSVYTPSLVKIAEVELNEFSSDEWRCNVDIENMGIITTGIYTFELFIWEINLYADSEYYFIDYLIPVYVEPIFIVTPANNTMITGTQGGVPFTLDVITPGLGASIVNFAQMKVIYPFIIPSIFNNTWVDMADVSESQFSSFLNEIDLSNASDEVQFEFKLTNNQVKTTNYNLTVFVDNKHPFKEFNEGLGERFHIVEDFLLSVNTSDDESGIQSVELRITEEFGERNTHQVIDLQFNASKGFWEYKWLVASNFWTEGDYTLEFTIINGAQLRDITTIIVTVDFTSPLLNIINPLNRTVISGNVSIQVSSFDAISDLSVFELTIDDSTIDLLNYPSVNSIYEYIFDTSQYTEGTIELIFFAENNAGLNSTLPLKYTIDNVLPILNLEGNLLMNGSRTLTLESIDANGFSKIAWKIDNSLYSEILTEANQTLIINSELYLDGNHNMTFFLADGASPANVQEFSFEIIVDNSNPQLSVQNLENGARLDFFYELIVEIFDATECELWISLDQGELIKIDKSLDGKWYVILRNYSLSSGTHQIALHAIDIVGNWDIDNYLFVYSDETPLPWPLIGGIAGGVVVLGGGSAVGYTLVKNKIKTGKIANDSVKEGVKKGGVKKKSKKPKKTPAKKPKKVLKNKPKKTSKKKPKKTKKKSNSKKK